jgi:uncharacterized membrane protein
LAEQFGPEDNYRAESAVATASNFPSSTSATGQPASDPGAAARGVGGDWLVRVLGWASAGTAGPLLLRPGGFGRAIGVGDGPRQRAAAAAAGVRELAAAAGLLRRPSPLWLWARVGGDVMDLALLGSALKSLGNFDNYDKRRTVGAMAAVAGITGLDVYAATTRSPRRLEMRLTASVTVATAAVQAYDLWRRLEILPSFLAHLDEVSATGPATSHWRASAPFGTTVEWDAEITGDVAGEWLSWRSLDNAAVYSEGDVRFTPAPGRRGTEVHVTLRYGMSGVKLAAAAARYFGPNPSQRLDDELRRFKQMAETGEVVRSEGAPGGKPPRREFPQHPARPLWPEELMEVLS